MEIAPMDGRNTLLEFDFLSFQRGISLSAGIVPSFERQRHYHHK